MANVIFPIVMIVAFLQGSIALPVDIKEPNGVASTLDDETEKINSELDLLDEEEVALLQDIEDDNNADVAVQEKYSPQDNQAENDVDDEDEEAENEEEFNDSGVGAKGEENNLYSDNTSALSSENISDEEQNEKDVQEQRRRKKKCRRRRRCVNKMTITGKRNRKSVQTV